MESRANYAMIGAFLLLMLVIGLAFIAWLANFGQNQNQGDVRVVFNGAVTGLGTGSQVLFNGIKIGEVRNLSLDARNPRTVVGIIRVSRNIPLKTDTRAMLSFQGLTGAATLQLEGGSRNAPLLFDSVQEGMPTIQAEISPFQDILESARNVLIRADSAMAAIDDFVTENAPAVKQTVRNVETFTGALADNSDKIDGVMKSISIAADAVRDISVSLKGTSAKAEQILAAVDPAEVGRFVEELNQSAERLRNVLDRAQEVADGIDPKAVNGMLSNIASAAETLDATAKQAQAVVAAVDPKDVDALIKSLNATSDGIRDTAARANALMAAVDQDKVKSIVGSVDVTARNLAGVSASIGGVVDQTRTTVGAIGNVVAAVEPDKVRSTVNDVSAFAASLSTYKPQIDGILTDVRSASASLQRLGDTVDQRRPDVDATITDARRLAEQLNGIAARADVVVAKVDRYVDGDGEGLIKEATAAAKSIREVADTLNARIGPIATNIDRFSGRGLDSFVALAEQGRQALGRLDRVLAGVERNPQQFIFGAEPVPQYRSNRH